MHVVDSDQEPSASIKVVLADDHPSLRTGIRMRLEMEPGMQVVGECNNGVEALEMVRQKKPDVLLLDMEMPELSGVDVARQLHASGTQVRILVLSAHEDAEYVSRLVEEGAVSGYLTKQESLETIVAALRGVAKGEEGWISREVAAAIIQSRRKETRRKDNRMHQLSRREVEVLGLIARGFHNQDIAEELFIAESTVKKHVSNIYTKLELKTRAEVTAWAWKQGIVEDDA